MAGVVPGPPPLPHGIPNSGKRAGPQHRRGRVEPVRPRAPHLRASGRQGSASPGAARRQGTYHGHRHARHGQRRWLGAGGREPLLLQDLFGEARLPAGHQYHRLRDDALSSTTMAPLQSQISQDAAALQIAETDGIDLSLIEDALLKTPEERLRDNSRTLATVDALRRALEEHHAGA